MTSDASEDENDVAQLRQAVDNTLFTDSLFGGALTVDTPQKRAQKRASLRLDPYSGDAQHVLRVSEGFRRFVAEGLDKILDARIEWEVSEGVRDSRIEGVSEGGVKLLRDSEGFLRDDESPTGVKRRRAKKKGRVSEESLQEVVVSGDDILSLKGTQHYTTPHTHRIYHYKQLDNGTATLIRGPR